MFRALFIVLGLALSLSSPGGAWAQKGKTDRPAMAYVAPPELVRLEHWVSDDPKTYRWPFKPVPAYDRPNGKRVGTFVGSESEPANNGCCEGGVRLEIGFPKVTRELGAPLVEWGYEIKGLVTGDEPVVAGDVTWSRIVPWKDGMPVAADAVWIRTESKHVHSYFELATYLQKVEVWCDRPGSCRKAPTQLDEVITKLNSITCVGDPPFPYTLKVVKASGAYFYKLELDKDALKLIPKDMIPYMSGYVPVFRPDGNHSGDFYSRGC